ncbi:MAG: ATP-dependent DNA helicase Rep [Turneriella sp.]|nr:ATP-dependent DNA helicase Rep [Turneriella sp.]
MSSKDIKPYLAELNPEQAYAALRLWESDKSALQVIAGAGSGKTTTLVASVLAAIDAGFVASRIAIITFSRKAAYELKERLAKQNVKVGYAGTMHALAWKLLRSLGAKEKILLHQQSIRANILRNLFAEYKNVPDAILLSRQFLSTEKYAQGDSLYAQYLTQNGFIDFDTMISRATKNNAGKDLFDAVFVDEFQDTSPDQVSFIESLGAKKLFAVGDDWQSIYRFRGADVSLTRDFGRRFKNFERVYLVKNYRSQKYIVKLGNKIIRESKTYVKKKLEAIHKKQKKPVLFFTSKTTKVEDAWKDFLVYARKKLAFLTEESVHVLVRTNHVRIKLERNKPNNFEVMTIHKSKGLEFDNVIVFGIAEHLMPHRDNDLDEEVRILYVALTRARHFLGFVGWEKSDGTQRSAFLEPLVHHAKLVYI